MSCRWLLLDRRCHCSMLLLVLRDVDTDALGTILFIVSFVLMVPLIVGMLSFMLPMLLTFFCSASLSMLVLTRPMMLIPLMMLTLTVPIIFS